MNPLIWIRTSSHSSNLLEVLEPFKLTNFFEKVDKDETIDLQVVKKDLPWAEIDQYEVKDPASVKLIEDILDFSPELDAMLIKELDNLAKEKKIAMQSLKSNIINPAEFCSSSDSPLQQNGEKVIKARSELLIGLINAWESVAKVIPFSKQPKTIGNKLLLLKYILPTSMSSKLLDDAVESIDNNYGEPSVSVNRRKAMVFADSGQIDHEGKYTIFGQIFQCFNSDSMLEYFAKKGTDNKCYSITFQGEGS